MWFSMVSIRKVPPNHHRQRMSVKLKKCYYETLTVDRTASEEELKKAYRVAALKWHPDKNRENLEEATARFKDIQVAYDVLSDPRERAWYDKHREEILRGRSDIVDDEAIDLIPYCTSACYDGFGDDEAGFYSVYRTLFDDLIKEDMPYYEDDTKMPPSFGNSKTPHEEVHEFYSHWQSYSTPKTYGYLVKYSSMDAPNRRVLRLIEKENSKLRDAARKERNQEVKMLVAFVRKRDKRMAARKKELEKVNEEKRQKSSENRTKQLQERRKEMENFAEDEWTSMSLLENELREIENNAEEGYEKKRGKKKNKRNIATVEEKVAVNEEVNGSVQPECLDSNEPENQSGDEDTLYCIACDKTFKSAKAFENHENSKKHKLNLAHLKAALAEDEEGLS
ncbi:DnaJ -like protein subfamily C member 21 [Halotydeus destructor]|nr:DnaJ -like protein subfamily C member 21 [Halotydeus destructor]